MSSAKKLDTTTEKPAKLRLAGTAPSAKPRFELTRIAPEQAIEVLRPAAEAGNAQAAYMLSLIYETGSGVARDQGAAERWFARAAELDGKNVATQLAARCRELLKVLALHCELLAERTAIDPEVHRHAEEICENVERLGRAISRLTQLTGFAASQGTERTA